MNILLSPIRSHQFLSPAILSVAVVSAAGHNFIKDIIVAVSVVVAVGGCYFAYTQHRRAQVHVHRLMKDLSSLQNAEDALSQLQQQYVTSPCCLSY